MVNSGTRRALVEAQDEHDGLASRVFGAEEEGHAGQSNVEFDRIELTGSMTLTIIIGKATKL